MEVRHPVYARITMDPEKCLGKPCIRGLRIPVASVIRYLSSGMSSADVLNEWPELESEDIHEALAFAASTLDDRFFPLEPNARVS